MARVWFSQVFVRQKRYVEAEEILTKVIDQQRYLSSARDGGEHSNRIQVLWFLLQCYQVQDKIEDAIHTSNELSEGVKRIGGEELGEKHVFAKLLADKQTELLAARRLPALELRGMVEVPDTSLLDTTCTFPLME